MRVLASLAMQGRPQAVMLTVLLAALSLFLPPASMLSSAVVALVTLRKGAVPGAVILLLATVVAGVLSQLVLGGLAPAMGFLLLLWLPIWLLAVLLRWSCSLSWALQGGLFLGLLAVVGQFIKDADPVLAWQALLEPFVQSLVDAQLLTQDQLPVLVGLMAQWMPGIVAAGFFLQSMVALFLARWWQATLFNPGAFRAEFHQLRLPRALAVLLGLILLVQLVLNQSAVTLLEYLLVLLVMAWALQGLALAHGMVGLLGSSSGWLIGIYLLLLFALPHALIMLALAGITDAWFDFRARRRSGNGPGEAS
jgi:hypothetical protein